MESEGPDQKRPRLEGEEDYSSQEIMGGDAHDVAEMAASTPPQVQRRPKQAYQILRLKKSGVPDLVLSAGKSRLRKGKAYYMWRDEHCSEVKLSNADDDDDVSRDEDALEKLWEKLSKEERAEWAKKAEKMPPLQYFVLVASLQLCTESHLFHASERELKKEEKASFFGLGKAIAVVRINDDATLADAVAKGWGNSPWAVGPYCYHIADVHVLKSPVPIKGALGAYHLSFSSRDEIISQLPLEHSLRKDPQVYHDLRGLSIKQVRLFLRLKNARTQLYHLRDSNTPLHWRPKALAAAHHSRGQGCREPISEHLHERAGIFQDACQLSGGFASHAAWNN